MCLSLFHETIFFYMQANVKNSDNFHTNFVSFYNDLGCLLTFLSNSASNTKTLAFYFRSCHNILPINSWTGLLKNLVSVSHSLNLLVGDYLLTDG